MPIKAEVSLAELAGGLDPQIGQLLQVLVRLAPLVLASYATLV